MFISLLVLLPHRRFPTTRRPIPPSTCQPHFRWLTCRRSVDQSAPISASAPFFPKPSVAPSQIAGLLVSTAYIYRFSTDKDDPAVDQLAGRPSVRLVRPVRPLFQYPHLSFLSSFLPHRRFPTTRRPIPPSTCQPHLRWLTCRRSVDQSAPISVSASASFFPKPSLVSLANYQSTSEYDLCLSLVY